MKLNVPVIGILRGIEPDFFGEVMAASFDAGLQAIEVTMNTEKAEEIVAAHLPKVPPGKILGMGTVRNLEEAKRAADAGAMFFVTPNLDTDVIRYAGSRQIPVIAGALTPSEVYQAWAAGAEMVKVFPVGAFGPNYIRELRGPFDRIPLVAVGGVTAENVGAYFAAGAGAVGVSTALFGKDALKERNVRRIGENVKAFINRCTLSSGTI